MTVPIMKVRLKRFPDRWVGKKNPTYAFISDQAKMSLDPDGSWYVEEKYAHIWTDVVALKRVVTASGYGRGPKPEMTFNEFEVVFGDGTVQPLNTVVGR